MINTKAFLFMIILTILGLGVFTGTAAALDHSGAVCDETWAASDNPHYIVGNITVSDNCYLNIQAGVEILFKGNYSITVAGDMTAAGTSNNPILFTKDTGVDHWYQISFSYNTNGTVNLSYCTIEYASYALNLSYAAASTIDHCTIQKCGYGIYFSLSGTSPAHVITNNTIQDNSAYGAWLYYPTDFVLGSGNIIQNNGQGIYFYACDNAQIAAGNTIRRNLDYGVYFGSLDQPVLLSGASENGVGVIYHDCSNIGTLENLTFANNADAAVRVENSGAFTLGGNNTISGNGWPLAIDVGAFPSAGSQIPTSGNLRNAIQVVAGTGDKTGTWPTFAGLDYILTGSNTIANAGSLTLSEGTTVRFQYNQQLRVDGQFYAVGSAQNPILFTRDSADSWYGILFYAGSQGDFRHAHVEYSYYGIYLSQTASVPVQDCVFEHNTNALYIAAGANIQVKRSRFYYNNYGAYIATGGTGTFGGSANDYNCFAGNRNYSIYNYLNAYIITAQRNYWGDADGPNHSSNPAGKGDMVNDNVDYASYQWVCENICECDLNNNGSCDGRDWLIFYPDWGRWDCDEPGEEPCECDLNSDGSCDGRDWLLFYPDWGRTDCPVRP